MTKALDLSLPHKVADMSLAYPLMRGCAPLLVALAGGLAFGERLPASGWLGIAVVSAGKTYRFCISASASSVLPERSSVVSVFFTTTPLMSTCQVKAMSLRSRLLLISAS